MPEVATLTNNSNTIFRNRVNGRTTSQFREAEILQEILNQCGEEIVPVCCDVGASDGKWYSNVYEFWHDRGWSAVLIERSTKTYPRLVENTKDYPVVALNVSVTPRGANSLDELFKKHQLSPQVGILNIDIDSFDFYVLEQLTYVQPQVIVIEFNHLIAPHLQYCDPENEVYLRCSLAAMRALGEEKGYTLYATTQCNCVFVLTSLAQKYLGAHRADLVRTWREKTITFLGFALGPSNFYPVFVKRRVWLYRKIIQGLMWCVYKLANFRATQKIFHQHKHSLGKKYFMKPSPSMQAYLRKANILA